MKKLLSIVFFFLFASNLFAQIELPSLVSDSMVLQRDKEVNIWGWASPEEKITIAFNKKKYNAVTGIDGKWKVALAAMKAGGPYDMTISSVNGSIELKDILIGDVWLCSGQSNMEFPLSRSKEKYAKDIMENPMIRQFGVTRAFSSSTQEKLNGEWHTANEKDMLKFTAVGYFFAKDLYAKYKVPIGLLHSSWGGTPAEAWTSSEGLKEFPKYLSDAAKYADASVINQIEEKEKQQLQAWNDKLKAADKGFLTDGTNWANPSYHDALWKGMSIPGYWEKQGEPNIDGVVWLRKEIDVPASLAGKDALLELGIIDDVDTTYFNGKKVGTMDNKYLVRKYKILGSFIKAGKNIITIRVTDKGENGGIVAGKPCQLKIGDAIINLAGNWKYNIGAAAAPAPVAMKFSNVPTFLYNGMISPLVNYGIKGILWYQGEANSGKAAEYSKLLPALIADWRLRFNQGDLPFLVVQLANYMAVNNEPTEGGWAWIRESQLKVTQAVPNTALAVAIDVGETNDIHPLNKKDVGSRLALAAQKIAYNEKNVVSSGPSYESMKMDGNKIILSFTNIGSGLLAKDGELKQFSISGEDKKFVWATAKIKGDKIVVWSDVIANPVAVRYAWSNNPLGSNLYNKENLPASPFRTDDWEKK